MTRTEQAEAFNRAIHEALAAERAEGYASAALIHSSSSANSRTFEDRAREHEAAKERADKARPAMWAAFYDAMSEVPA